MICPECGENSIIKMSAEDIENEEFVRLRQCKQCGHKFGTVEFVVDIPISELQKNIKRMRRGYSLI